jgi:hypothetical protein
MDMDMEEADFLPSGLSGMPWWLFKWARRPLAGWYGAKLGFAGDAACGLPGKRISCFYNSQPVTP